MTTTQETPGNHPDDTISSAQGGDPVDHQSAPKSDSRSSGKEKNFPVIELFGPTIEGEGAVIGTPTMFIRFGLCDFKCTNCDSWHSVDPKLVKKLASWMTAQEIYDDLVARSPKHIRTVTFSGGNPAIHELTKLVKLLKEGGWFIVMETQGTKYKDWMKQVDHMVISPKGPGMGESFDNEVFDDFYSFIREGNVDYSIKVVIFSAIDLEFARGVMSVVENTGIEKICPSDYEERLYLSLGNPHPPVFSIDPEDGQVVNDSIASFELVSELLARYNTLSNEILSDARFGKAKFLPQLHVLVWGNETEK